jgi:hypothetical protein
MTVDNDNGFTVCAVAATVNAYPECDENDDYAKCFPVLVSNGLYPGSDTSGSQAGRRGWSLGMNRRVCRCGQAKQHLAAWGPHHVNVQLGGFHTENSKAQALGEYDNPNKWSFDGVFTGRRSNSFPMENGVLGEVDDLTWGAIDACQRDRSIDWERDDYCLDDAWPGNHAAAPQRETWHPKLVCYSLDGPKSDGPSVAPPNSQDCWAAGDGVVDATGPATPRLNGVALVVVADSDAHTWQQCSAECMHHYQPYGQVHVDTPLYFQYTGTAAMGGTCSCGTAVAGQTITLVSGPSTTGKSTVGRACAYKTGRLYFNGVEVAKEAVLGSRLDQYGGIGMQEPWGTGLLHGLTLGAASQGHPASAPALAPRAHAQRDQDHASLGHGHGPADWQLGVGGAAAVARTAHPRPPHDVL